MGAVTLQSVQLYVPSSKDQLEEHKEVTYARVVIQNDKFHRPVVGQ